MVTDGAATGASGAGSDAGSSHGRGVGVGSGGYGHAVGDAARGLGAGRPRPAHRAVAPYARRMQPRPVPPDLVRHLRRARDHMDRHYTEPIDLARLARVAGVSKYHFARCFEATFGLTPMRARSPIRGLRSARVAS